MNILILKTFRYGPLRAEPAFSLAAAFRRLHGVIQTARSVLPASDCRIALPQEEIDEARAQGVTEKLCTLAELRSDPTWQKNDPLMLVFDEQGFYASPDLVKKVIGRSAGEACAWEDPEKILWSFNYTHSARFFVAPASSVARNLERLETSGFAAIQEKILEEQGGVRLSITPEDLPAVYRQAVKFNPYPYHFYIEPTSRCNSDCIMCPFHSPDPKIAEGRVYVGKNGKDMPVATFKSLVDQVSAIGWNYLPWYRTPQITAQLRGEPTLAPGCREMFAYVKEKGLRLSFSTNGSTLHQDGLAEFLIEINTDEIVVSIDGNEEEYRKIRPRLDFQQVVENIERLGELRREMGKDLPVIYTKRVRLQHSSEAADKSYLERFTPLVDWAGITFENFDDFRAESKGFSSYFFEVENEKRVPCIWAADVSVIKSDGSVDLCFGASNHVLGNINEQPLLEILEGSSLRKKVVENHGSGCFNDPHFCGPCTSWKSHYSRQYEEDGYQVQMNPILAYWNKTDAGNPR